MRFTGVAMRGWTRTRSRSACAWSAARRAWRKPCASATRSRPSTRTARQEVGAPGNRRARSWPLFRHCSRKNRRAPKSATRWPEMQLRELAHARTGDKGDTSQISVIAYEEGDYAFLAEHITAERVRAHFASIV